MSPATNVAAWDDLTALNHDKAWKVLCRMEREHLLVLLSRALRFVPPGKPQRDLQRSRGGKQTFEAKLDLLFDRRAKARQVEIPQRSLPPMTCARPAS